MQSHERKTAPRVMRRGSATADDQFAYFASYGSRSVYRYQWSTEKWERLPKSPYWNSGLVIIDGKLTAVGGWNGSRDSGRANQLITLQQGQWIEHYPPMNIERYSPAVVSTPDGNYILVIGGKVDVHWTTVVELLDVRSRIWYRLTNLPQAPIRPSVAICCNQQIHVLGRDGDGYSSSLQAILSDNGLISQPISNVLKWRRLNQLPVRWSTAATLNGQQLVVSKMGHKSIPFTS